MKSMGQAQSYAQLTRAIDERLTQLSQKGIIGPHQPCTGEEYTLAGAACALEKTDWVFWGRQVCVPALVRDMPLSALLAFALAPVHAQSEFAQRLIVNNTHGPAARLPHATGLAWAARRDNVAVLCELGDQAVSDADFHVGVNFAAVMNAPVVFLVRQQTGAPSALPRAEGYGIAGEAVDGMDANAVESCLREALTAARTDMGLGWWKQRFHAG